MTSPPSPGSRPRVFFVVNSLEGGGAERVFATLIGALDARGAPYGIELVLLDTFPELHPIPERVPRHRLGARMSLPRSIAGLVRLARRERPDLLFSFLTRSNVAAVIAGGLAGCPAVISERVHTTSHFGEGRAAAVNRAVVRALYPRAADVIAVSHGVADDLAGNYGVARERLVVIPNPVRQEEIARAAREEPAVPVTDRDWVAVGRLVPNKNVPMLLEAFAASGVDGDLVVLGEGPERAALEARAAALGLGSRVRFPGHVGNPYAVLARARAYLSASNAEGFPNALAEALNLGRPVAVTDCDSGPAEILRGASAPKVKRATRLPAGYLVPVGRPDAMADALRGLAEPGAAEAASEAALATGRRYGLDGAVDAYDAVIRRRLGLA